MWKGCWNSSKQFCTALVILETECKPRMQAASDTAAFLCCKSNEGEVERNGATTAKLNSTINTYGLLHDPVKRYRDSPSAQCDFQGQLHKERALEGPQTKCSFIPQWQGRTDQRCMQPFLQSVSTNKQTKTLPIVQLRGCEDLNWETNFGRATS